MIASRTQALRARQGEPITAEKWNGLLDQIDQAIRARPGPGLLSYSLPSGNVFVAQRGRGIGGGGGMGDHPFKATVTPSDLGGTALDVRFNLGLIAGVEPRIAEDAKAKKISDESAPKYTFDYKTAVDPATGRGGLYWHLALNTDYSIQRIYPEVFQQPPAARDYTAYKLIGFLIRDPADASAAPAWKQMLFHNLNHTARQRHGPRALHTFFVIS